MKTTTKLKLLTTCMFVAQQSYALELLQEQEMSDVTGQDGIVITHEVSKVEIDKLNWYDPNANSNVQMGLGLDTVRITGQDQKSIVSTIELDVGETLTDSGNKGAGIRLAASVDPFEMNANLNLLSKKIAACDSDCDKTQSLGQLGVSIHSPFKVVLQTTAGLFNKNEVATIDFNLQDAMIKHTMGKNSLVLDNFNFNFAGAGYIYVEPKEGIVLTSNNGSKDHYINLKPVEVLSATGVATGAKTAGVNFDLRYHTTDDEGNVTEKNIMRYGISGAVNNARLSLSANQSASTIASHQTAINNFDITNKTDDTYKSEVKATTAGYNEGNGGLHLNLSADFVNQDVNNDLKATTLEIGHTGKGSYAVQFQNLRTLTGVNPAYIDFGDIYINTIQANSLEFLINDKIRKALGFKDTYLIKQQLVKGSDATGDFALVAIRAMDFQSIAGKANFISNDTGLVSDNSGSWGIGIPIYNLNANIALSGTTVNNQQAIAYNIMASTDGYGIDKVTNSPSTTSILIIDGENNYYAGLRNIDAFFKSNGTISYEDKGIHIAANELLIAADAELAIGKLPSIDAPDASFNFANRDDVLTNISFKLDGSGNLFIIPGINSSDPEKDTNFLTLEGDFKFRPLAEYTTEENQNNLGSYFSLSNIDGEGTGEKISSITLKEMQGHLGYATQIKVQKDTVVLDNQVKFNHNKDINQAFRTNFAMQTNNNMQNMANIAITGGTLRSTLGITPR